MKVTVGSCNPVKIAAAQAVFSQIAPSVEVEGVRVSSGVSAQPWGDAETRRGAINRARAALQDGADYAVGFEGGVIETESGLMSCAWCAVLDRFGRVGVGGSLNFLLPERVARDLRVGHELGDVMDRLTGAHNTKQSMGAIGILSDGLMDRQQAYEHLLAAALTRFRRPDLYESE